MPFQGYEHNCFGRPLMKLATEIVGAFFKFNTFPITGFKIALVYCVAISLLVVKSFIFSTDFKFPLYIAAGHLEKT